MSCDSWRNSFVAMRTSSLNLMIWDVLMRIQHRIRMTDNTPVVMPYRRIPPTRLEEVKDHLQKLLRNGSIVESRSDNASAIVLVPKRSSSPTVL